jgi:hypothetical protein
MNQYNKSSKGIEKNKMKINTETQRHGELRERE